jgi:hypothetical protein
MSIFEEVKENLFSQTYFGSFEIICTFHPSSPKSHLSNSRLLISAYPNSIYNPNEFIIRGPSQKLNQSLRIQKVQQIRLEPPGPGPPFRLGVPKTAVNNQRQRNFGHIAPADVPKLLPRVPSGYPFPNARPIPPRVPRHGSAAVLVPAHR